MKKLEKLKLNEMQDFSAIEKQESQELKGGLALRQEAWHDLMGWLCIYNWSNEVGSGDIGNGYYTGYSAGGNTLGFGVSGPECGSSAIDTNRVWVKRQGMDGFMSYDLGSEIVFPWTSQGLAVGSCF